VRPDDEAAFRDFVTTRSPSLLRTAYLLTGDFGLAEDAVQAMFGRVYQSWPKIRHREAADSYCRRALIREVGSWRRRRRIQHVLTDQVPERAVVHERYDEDDSLRTALVALPHQQRAVVVLRYYADLSEAEVADLLDISAGSVKQHTHRALTKLREALGSKSTLIEETES
jgi:RNA polymerase sigma-70 factor (sigma-E family)